MSSEYEAREGSSSRSWRRRRATGMIILRATERKPAWQRLSGSSRKPTGETGSMLRLTAQSMNVAVPRMAKTMVFM